MSGISTAEFGKLVRARRTEKRWTLEELAHHALGNADRKGYISQIETGKLPKISALTVQKLGNALGIEPELIDRMLGVVAPDAAEAREDVAELRRKYGSLQEVLDDLSRRTRADLIALATQFGVDRAYELRTADLHTLLEGKAEEYRALRAQIERIDDRAAGLGNLKAAARDAAERLDFAEVEALLARVDQVETEIAAETKELRAANALLRGRVEEAYNHFAAAAASFAGIDPLEVARRSGKYSNDMYFHGLRYDGDSLHMAARMAALALERLSSADAPDLWSRLQNSLGNALSARADRVGGVIGTDLMIRGVAAYRAALTVFTQDKHAPDWAITQHNLGCTLTVQGKHTAGTPGALLCEEAVKSFRASLQVRTYDQHPREWAMTQNNLGNALFELGQRTAADDGTRLLAEAVTSYRAALGVYTKESYTRNWASTQNNLGGALMEQGKRSTGADAAALLDEAEAAFRASLSIRSEDPHSFQWATIQSNLALLETIRAHLDICTNPGRHLIAALDHVNTALRVYDPNHSSHDYAKATAVRDIILAAIASLAP